ncbi:MAG: transposase [Thermodesulfobacteriota bacterium]
MARPLRIEYPGAFYHITSRGNERRPIFRTKGDYERFIGYLESATERYGAQIHCFCLMPNHYHLLLETQRGNLQAILHHLNTAYTNYFNRKTGRVGHLFQGRYRAILVEKDSYALELSRYIHLNPVRAKLVDRPSRYPWSSYLAYTGKAQGWDWLRIDFILDQMGLNRRRAQGRYRGYVKDGIEKGSPDPLKNVAASTLLGSEKFINWVREKWIDRVASHRDLPALRKLSLRPEFGAILKESESRFGRGTTESRRVAMYLCHRLSGRPLEEIGDFFGEISSSGVSQNTRRLEKVLEKDEKLSEEVSNLKKKLSQ